MVQSFKSFLASHHDRRISQDRHGSKKKLFPFFEKRSFIIVAVIFFFHLRPLFKTFKRRNSPIEIDEGRGGARKKRARGLHTLSQVAQEISAAAP